MTAVVCFCERSHKLQPPHEMGTLDFLIYFFFIYLFLFSQFVRRRAVQMFEQVQTSLTFQTFFFFATRFGSDLHPFFFFVLKGKKCPCREDKVTASLTRPSRGRSGESLQPESCIPKIAALTVV